MNRRAFLYGAVIFAQACLLCEPVTAQSSQSIEAILQTDPRFSRFAAWVKAAGAAHRLSSGGPYTVFAPRNEAFGSLTPGLEQAMLKPQNQGRLLSVVLYHVVPGARPYGALKTGTIPALNRQLVSVSNVNGIVQVNGYGISSHDIVAANGIIHPSSGVLVPPMTENM